MTFNCWGTVYWSPGGQVLASSVHPQSLEPTIATISQCLLTVTYCVRRAGMVVSIMPFMCFLVIAFLEWRILIFPVVGLVLYTRRIVSCVVKRNEALIDCFTLKYWKRDFQSSQYVSPAKQPTSSENSECSTSINLRPQRWLLYMSFGILVRKSENT